MDVLDISDTVAVTGEIKVVKVLGVVALVDEGETDWKIIAIDIKDPLAAKLDGTPDSARLIDASGLKCLFNCRYF